MSKRLIHRETREALDEVVGLIAKRSNVLVEQAKLADRRHEGENAQQLRKRAWELEMVLQDIERNFF
jgi:hypothetical protein